MVGRKENIQAEEEHGFSGTCKWGVLAGAESRAR